MAAAISWRYRAASDRGVVSVARLGNEMCHRFHPHSAVVASSPGEIEEDVLVYGVPHHSDLIGARQRDHGRQLWRAEPRGFVVGRIRSYRRVHQTAQSATSAAAAASETVEAAALGIDVQRRMVVVMERTQIRLVAGPEPNADLRPEFRELGPLACRAHRHQA
jgi:hypothetical protein